MKVEKDYRKDGIEIKIIKFAEDNCNLIFYPFDEPRDLNHFTNESKMLILSCIRKK